PDLGGDGIEHVELGRRLDVEGEYAFPQSVGHLVARFADSRKDDLPRVGARGERAIELTAGDDVETAAFLRESREHGELRVRLDRVANDVWRRPESFVEDAVMPSERCQAVHVTGRADLVGDLRERNPLGAELASLVLEEVHGRTATVT